MAHYEQRSLGHAVSHGCVRLSLANARVKRQKMANTTVVVTGDIPGGEVFAGRDCRSEALRTQTRP